LHLEKMMTNQQAKAANNESVERPPILPRDLEPTNRREATQSAVTAFVVLFCIVGIALWGLPFYYDFMVREFGWSRAQVTSGNALSKLLVGPIFGFSAGWIVDRFGPRRIMMAGIVMAGIALVGLGSVTSLGMFYFFYLFNALGFVCGGPLPIQVLLSRWFVKSRGKAMGFAYLGIGVGGTVVPLLSHALAQNFGWQRALQTLGLLIVLLAFPLAFFVKEAPASMTVRPDTAQVAAKRAFKSKSFYLLAVGSMCSVAAISGTQQNLKLFLSLDRHYAQGEAARILSLVLAFSIAGRLIMGWMADRYSKKAVMLLIYILVAVAIPLLFFSQAPFTVYAFAAVFGIGLGGDYMIVPLMTAEIFGVQVLGRLMGVILTADGIAEATSPWLMGHLRDTTGSYLQGYLLLAGVGLIGAATVIALPKPVKAA
jgi:sugar phosphate permease